MFSGAMAQISTFLAKILSLRTAVFALAAAFLYSLPLSNLIQDWSQAIDSALFRTALSHSSPPTPTQPITVVHVPDVEYDRWLQDLTGAQSLLQLLQLANTEDAESHRVLLGLVLERPMSFIKSSAESELEEIARSGAPLGEEQSVTQLLKRREQLISALGSADVVIGVQQQFSDDLVSVQSTWTSVEALSEPFRQWLWPTVTGASANPLPISPVPNQYPILKAEGPARALVHRRGDQYLPSFSLGFLRAAATDSTGADTPFVWLREEGVVIADQLHRMSVNGEVVPLYGAQSGLKTSVRQINLRTALQLDELTGWVLVGRDGSDILSTSAQTLAALAENAVLVELYWWPPAKKALTVLLALFLLIVTPFMPAAKLLQSGVLVALLLLGGSFLAQVLSAAWLPVGDLVLFWCAGMLLMLTWREKRKAQIAVVTRAERVSFDHATLLVQSYRYPEAFATLRACRTSRRLLQHLYRLATLQREQGFNREALTTLQEIQRRRRRYKDVEQQIERVREVVAHAENSGKKAASTRDWLHTSGAGLESTQMLTAGPVTRRTLGRYQILQELGRGSSGTVYLAHDPKIAREVAIKTLNYHAISSPNLQEVKTRFFREAIAAGRLHHPNIVQVFDVGEEDKLAYIAMDYARGKPLSSFVQPHSLLSIVDVYRVAVEVADALAYAHEQHVIHRDIKPSNIVFNPDPFQIRIMDFGIARITDYAQTSDSKILGSPLYMAPEQLLGHESGPSADIFSLGVMLYQLLSGRLPFMGDNLASLSYEIVHANHKSVRSYRSELPPSATRITNRALQKQPQARYESAGDMAAALRAALEGELLKEVEQHDLSA